MMGVENEAGLSLRWWRQLVQNLSGTPYSENLGTRVRDVARSEGTRARECSRGARDRGGGTVTALCVSVSVGVLGVLDLPSINSLHPAVRRYDSGPSSLKALRTLE